MTEIPIRFVTKQSGHLVCPHCGKEIPYSLSVPSGVREQEIQRFLEHMAANNEEISSRTLAKKADICPRVARHWLKIFVDRGLLSKIRRTRGGSIYQIK